MARPRWVHHDDRPYDDFDFGKTRLYDELDADRDQSRRSGLIRRLRNRLRNEKGRPSTRPS
jgi:hypothetical protein